ncbi:LysR family transcriptional regulator [Bradyrhizobium liaoningense]|uniref:LysR family transcriptional regulator n=1 Tax=Bradyrhizobium liaoningense TaxID=43992 RepID=UPI001BA61024|nr:LysR family transcriptional regulator [Bradyrhizobium liaoningense]
MARRPPNVSGLPLNALRAFEAAARHLSFTKAGLELRVSQAAVSQQVRTLERSLRADLFRRLTRGLALTEEGEALLPAISDAFGRINQVLDRFENGRMRETLMIGVVGTFAAGWLVPRLKSFTSIHPQVDIKVFANNNRVDLGAEGLDYAIRFGDGAWHGTNAERLVDAFFTPMSTPTIAKSLKDPIDLHQQVLLRSYRSGEWTQWFEAAKCRQPRMTGPTFDSSVSLAHAAAQGGGVALLPVVLFSEDVARKRLACPYDTRVHLGSYWLTSLKSKRHTHAMQAFRQWILAECKKMKVE